MFGHATRGHGRFDGPLCFLILTNFFQALTRVYNQPTAIVNGKVTGVLYKNPIDCMWKTVKAEGLRGLYKGQLN